MCAAGVHCHLGLHVAFRTWACHDQCCCCNHAVTLPPPPPLLLLSCHCCCCCCCCCCGHAAVVALHPQVSWSPGLSDVLQQVEAKFAALKQRGSSKEEFIKLVRAQVCMAASLFDKQSIAKAKWRHCTLLDHMRRWWPPPPTTPPSTQSANLCTLL
jgi:hypothetical protein